MNVIRSALVAAIALVLACTTAPCHGEDAIKALDEVCSVTFKDTTLGDAMSLLSDPHNVRITFGEGVDKTPKITYSATGKKLRVALTEILEPLKLNFVAAGEIITIAPVKK